MADPDAPVGLHFKVRIDDVDASYDLGVFISCSGLAMEVQTEDREEGGNNGFVHKLPVRIKYSPIKFQRPVSKESAKVAKWIASMGATVKRTTAQIVAMTPDGKDVVGYTLIGVIPTKWTGPEFSAESPKLATESLEICHQGLTVEEMA